MKLQKGECDMHHLIRKSKKTIIGILGGIVILLGLIMVPYPGPGWLVVFAGLAILATEFDWAQEILDMGREKYDQWQDWLRRQSLTVKIIFWTLTFIVVSLTIWLLNGYGLINTWLNLGLDWLNSPLPFFS